MSDPIQQQTFSDNADLVKQNTAAIDTAWLDLEPGHNDGIFTDSEDRKQEQYPLPESSLMSPKLLDSIKRSSFCALDMKGRYWSREFGLAQEVEVLCYNQLPYCLVSVFEHFLCFWIDSLCPYIESKADCESTDRKPNGLWTFIRTEIIYPAQQREWHRLLRDEQVVVIEALIRSSIDELQELITQDAGMEKMIVALEQLRVARASFLRRMRSARLEILILTYLGEEEVKMEVSDGVHAATAEYMKQKRQAMEIEDEGERSRRLGELVRQPPPPSLL
ncbi:hypothetical protein BJ508DRAFT_171345 [Ascobolus immersus RN42]|uniref:Uncharacterized protein n=1 Tax=Ascobolus immersus RN42 TaxID=1160509 RepID=A0A3N4HY29_ASCIM|nr:hypothetical protein BJ508DRAFT_171345 [Ascobolus immersus RN42]